MLGDRTVRVVVSGVFEHADLPVDLQGGRRSALSIIHHQPNPLDEFLSYGLDVFQQQQS